MANKTDDPLAVLIMDWNDKEKRNVWMEVVLNHLSTEEKRALRDLINERQGRLEQGLQDIIDYADAIQGDENTYIMEKIARRAISGKPPPPTPTR